MLDDGESLSHIRGLGYRMSTENGHPITHIPMSEDLSGREKVRVMLLARGFEIKEWAELPENGFSPSQMSMMLSGTRPYPEIREKLAAFLGLSVDQFNTLIPLPEAA